MLKNSLFFTKYRSQQLLHVTQKVKLLHAKTTHNLIRVKETNVKKFLLYATYFTGNPTY